MPILHSINGDSAEQGFVKQEKRNSINRRFIGEQKPETGRNTDEFIQIRRSRARVLDLRSLLFE